ncbi:hypothetical protein FOZ63_029001 [Perkinsus olseni]|uniref:Uncharacterized protein n=1 Tax=Perkinsus olseni TaxID=32597 RepID=A0A7J6TTQ7_PEROL|nr:hypothetical protein FOZ60_003502 [Perkinsus olseni]KAF4713038.1 hypothetical protein FOZ62_025779 [Perkinsus olseni]KAF4747786.1 hypothetical protein FOZ63_029001 [Perkinsus olseni]
MPGGLVLENLFSDRPTTSASDVLNAGNTVTVAPPAAHRPNWFARRYERLRNHAQSLEGNLRVVKAVWSEGDGERMASLFDMRHYVRPVLASTGSAVGLYSIGVCVQMNNRRPIHRALYVAIPYAMVMSTAGILMRVTTKVEDIIRDDPSLKRVFQGQTIDAV